MLHCFQFNGSCENLKRIILNNESFHLSDCWWRTAVCHFCSWGNLHSQSSHQLLGGKGQIPSRSGQELPVDSQGLQISPGASDVPQCAAVTCVLKGKGTCGQPALFGPWELSDQTYHKALPCGALLFQASFTDCAGPAGCHLSRWWAQK